MSRPPVEWLAEQAKVLSSDKDEDAVGALAWNLAVAFRRWSDEEWQPIITAPREPIRINHINDFLPDRLGPLILMSIPFSPEPSVTVGFWCPEHQCWRHLNDDGPNDIEPTHWKPFPKSPGSM